MGGTYGGGAAERRKSEGVFPLSGLRPNLARSPRGPLWGEAHSSDKAPVSYTRARSTSASNPSLSLDRSTNATASLAVPSLPIPITKLSRWVVALAHQRPSAAQFLSSLVHVSLPWSISGFGPPPLHLRGFAGPAVMDGKKARKRQTERRIVSMGSA